MPSMLFTNIYWFRVKYLWPSHILVQQVFCAYSPLLHYQCLNCGEVEFSHADGQLALLCMPWTHTGAIFKDWMLNNFLYLHLFQKLLWLQLSFPKHKTQMALSKTSTLVHFPNMDSALSSKTWQELCQKFRVLVANLNDQSQKPSENSE